MKRLKKSIQACASAIVNIPDLKNIHIPLMITAKPRTPHWTDRSRNGRGFHCLFTQDEVKIDLEGTGRKSYRRH